MCVYAARSHFKLMRGSTPTGTLALLHTLARHSVSVVSIDLGGCGLAVVPQELSALSALSSLDLGGNWNLAGGLLACVYSLFHRKGTCDTDPPRGLGAWERERLNKE